MSIAMVSFPINRLVAAMLISFGNMLCIVFAGDAVSNAGIELNTATGTLAILAIVYIASGCYLYFLKKHSVALAQAIIVATGLAICGLLVYASFNVTDIFERFMCVALLQLSAFFTAAIVLILKHTTIPNREIPDESVAT